MTKRQQQVEELRKQWEEDNRWKGIERPYTPEEVIKLRGSLQIEHTLARKGAERLWNSLHKEDFINVFKNSENNLNKIADLNIEISELKEIIKSNIRIIRNY